MILNELWDFCDLADYQRLQPWIIGCSNCFRQAHSKESAVLERDNVHPSYRLFNPAQLAATLPCNSRIFTSSWERRRLAGSIFALQRRSPITAYTAVALWLIRESWHSQRRAGETPAFPGARGRPPVTDFLFQHGWGRRYPVTRSFNRGRNRLSKDRFTIAAATPMNALVLRPLHIRPAV
jgi:hypothetical protein